MSTSYFYRLKTWAVWAGSGLGLVSEDTIERFFENPKNIGYAFATAYAAYWVGNTIYRKYKM